MIDTKSVSPHSMFLKYLRDVALSLKEESSDWSIKTNLNFNKIDDGDVYCGIINLSEKTISIQTPPYYGSLFDKCTLDGFIFNFKTKYFSNGIPDDIFEEISFKILEGLSFTVVEDKENSIFRLQEKRFEEFNPLKQFSNFYQPQKTKDKRLLEIYSEFISEENIDNVLNEYPTFIAEIILYYAEASDLEKMFSKENILKSLINFCNRDLEYFSLVDQPKKMAELYSYIFDDNTISEDYKNKLKILFVESFFEKVVTQNSESYFTFGDRFTDLFNSCTFEEFCKSHPEDLQFYFEKSLIFLSEIEDRAVFNLYNDRAFNCLGAFEFIFQSNKLGYHHQLSKNYNDIVIQSVLKVINETDINNIEFVFDPNKGHILNLFTAIHSFETNCKLEEIGYRKETNKFFNELRVTFNSLSEIISEDEQQGLDILQLELELYQKKFDLFYQNFE